MLVGVAALVAACQPNLDDTVSIVSADDLASLPAVIIAPRDPVRLGAANRALERAGVPWRLRATNALTDARAAPLEAREGGPLAGADATQATQWYALDAQSGAVADTVVTVGGAAPWAACWDSVRPRMERAIGGRRG